MSHALFSACSCSLRLVLFTLVSGMLSGCSQTTSDNAAASPTPATAPARSPSTRVDSLNGSPGHHFGEPLSAFPGLVPTEGPSEPGYATYYYPAGSSQEKGWFGKHHREVGSVFYRFHAGKFANFRVIAYDDKGKDLLRREALFLLGPGKTGLNRTQWTGTRAWAVYASQVTNGESTEQLDVISVPLQEDQQREQRAKLRADNATP